jgi:hypothetical protein
MEGRDLVGSELERNFDECKIEEQKSPTPCEFLSRLDCIYLEGLDFTIFFCFLNFFGGFDENKKKPRLFLNL